MIKAILAGITPFIVILALTAFVTWNADVSTWSESARYLCAIVGLVVGPFVASFVWSEQS
jgi:hypothetical protein